MERIEGSVLPPRPMYKKRRVFGTRDFPPGCGRIFQKLDPGLATETETITVVNENSICANRDFPSGCGRTRQQLNPGPATETETIPVVNEDSICSEGLENGYSEMLEDLHEVVAANLNDEIAPSLLDRNFFSPLPTNGFSAVSDGNGLHKRVARKFPPRRRVSAVRDFPPNCGRNTLHNGSEENGESLMEKEKTDAQKISEDPWDGDLIKIPEVAKERAEVLASVVNETVGRETSIEGTVMTNTERDSQPKESSPKRKSSGPARLSHVSDNEALTQTANLDKTGVHHKRKRIDRDDLDTKSDQEEPAVKQNESSFEDGLVWWDHELETVAAKDGEDDDDDNADDSGEHVDESAILYADNEIKSDRVNVLGLMAASCCPWGQQIVPQNSNQPASTSGTKGTLAVEGKRTKITARKSVNVNASNVKKPAGSESGSEGAGHLLIWDKDKSLENDGHHAGIVSDSADICIPLKSKGKKLERIKPAEGKITKMTARKTVHANASNVKKKRGKGKLIVWEEVESSERNENKNRRVATVSRTVDMLILPVNPKLSSDSHNESGDAVMRHKVREVLRRFQGIYRKLLHEMEIKQKEGKPVNKRIDLRTGNLLKQKGAFVNEGKQIFGLVPGVEVGDEFQYRIELTVIGLHRQIQGGIDYGKRDGKSLATSIVASGGYKDDLENSDVLIYSGQGGNVVNAAGKAPEDQKLERGNLALKNSFDDQNPVRVIRGFDSAETKSKMYVYDGLYLVERFWQDLGLHGKLVFQFQLRRIPGQPELAWKEVKKSKKNKARHGLCHNDISHGKESIPICAVNTVDDEKPPLFKYVTKMRYPDWYKPNPPKGCKCTNRCSDSAMCSCAVSNGGEIPYTLNGSIVEVKTLVYECGPACRCSSSCPNRSSQRGIKFQLEIFKTEKRGWGVRSLNSIPSGSFICEYIGELLNDKEADERTGNDEYLFDIGNNFNENSLFDGLETLVPDVLANSPEAAQEGGYTIDAAEYGNVGRFINHCCSPNLYAQNVLYDHDDKRIPHIMFFAAENIPPLQELTYHYNYKIDEVRDSSGKIKKKSCFCGAADCSGRLY